jgi:hypothetical protein
MKVWKSFAAGISLSIIFGAAGILAAFAPSKRDGYPVDGRVSSMTPDQLQRAIAKLGLEARSFTYDTSQKHVLRVEVDDYVDGKPVTSERIGRHDVPYVGRQTFMLFCDTRDKDYIVLSEDFMSPSGSGVGAQARFRKPKGWGTWWSDSVVLRVNEKAPLLYLIDQGEKSITLPMPIDKVVSEYPRVIVVTVSLEPEGK